MGRRRDGWRVHAIDPRLVARGRRIHPLLRADQWEHIRALLYADVPEVLLLTIDPSRLTSPWQLDPVEDDEYPHIYGPLNLEAVIAVKHLA